MKELERVVADYRSMKAMKEQIDAEVKSLEYEIIGYMEIGRASCRERV